MRAGPSQEEIRRHNLGALLRSVHVSGAVSRAELTASLGLNRSTIGALTAELAAAGLVTEETPRDRGRAGRPSLVVRPESYQVYVLAFAIEADRLTAARVGLGGLILDRRETSRPPGEASPAEVVAPLAEFARQMARATPRHARLIGSAVATNPVVRGRNGLLRPGASGGGADTSRAPFASALTQALADALARTGSPGGAGRPPALVSRGCADLAALAEYTRGAATGRASVIYLHGDGGVDGSVITGGRQLTGQDGTGGQIGHMVVNPAGQPCGCGSRGCWETEIGEYALLSAAGRPANSGRTGVAAVINAASHGDTRAQAALHQVGEWLGFGVANLVTIFNPEMVLFGGTLRDVYLASTAQVGRRLTRAGSPERRSGLRLRTATLGEDGVLLGAAELAFERLLSDPLTDPAI
jgi:predicted NBD/HSP70 family sugar kinase